MTNKIVAIDLFCGVGGLTHGLRNAGILVPAGVDVAEECTFAFEYNNPGSRFIHEDVATLKGEDLESIWGNAKFRLLAGCAPCQPFSTFRQSSTLGTDNRYFLLSEFARLIDESKPELVTMENVPNLLKKSIFRDFVGNLEAAGYMVSYQVIDCQNVGVPQARKRLVLLASRIGTAPEITFESACTTVRDRLSKLPKLAAGGIDKDDSLHRCASLTKLNLKRIRASRPGGSWREWPEEILSSCHRRKSGKGYTPVYGRMEWDKPSVTLTTQCYNYGSGRFGHPDQDRALSLREAALLQDFPVEYEFEPKGMRYPTTKIARMIGNAVPVGLGRVIGESINNHVKKVRQYAG